MKRLTTEQFIERAKNIHGDKYNYELVVYTTAKAKVNIICKEHGIFPQEAFSHLTGCGCPKCFGFIDTKEFIRQSKNIHKNKYEYNETIYIDGKTPVTIKCPEHGNFLQKPEYHLQGNGCQKCCGRGTTTNEFIEKANIINNNKYNYGYTVFEKMDKDVKIVCKNHGLFWQSPSNHLRNMGCPKCGDILGTEKRTKTLEEFLKEAKHIHGEKYDYSKVKYVNWGKYITKL